MSRQQELLQDSVKLGESILTLPVVSDGDSALFLESLDRYLSKVGELEKLLKIGPVEVTAEEGRAFLVIQERIKVRAESEKNSVVQRMSDLHRRSLVLKSYLDVAPGRVSITGKREG